jgi:hypothetical protein
MLTLSTYEAYFNEQIVHKYSKLNGFYHIDMFEFDSFVNDLRSGIVKTPVLVLESYQVNTIAQKNDNIHNGLKGALTILGNFNLRQKASENKTAFLAEMESIIFQIRAKMLEDSKKACHVIYGLIPESITIGKTETIAGNFQGFRMSFAISDPDETELSTDWQ